MCLHGALCSITINLICNLTFCLLFFPLWESVIVLLFLLYIYNTCHYNKIYLLTYLLTSMFFCMLLYVHSSIAIILMGKRELIDLLNLSSWCLVMVERLFLAVPRGCLQFVFVVFPDHTFLLFLLS